MQNNPKINAVLIGVGIILLITAVWIWFPKNKQTPLENTESLTNTVSNQNTNSSQTQSTVATTTPAPITYTYKNHGFTMQLPVGYVPRETAGETGPTTSIELPQGWLIYVSDAAWWEQHNIVGQTVYLRSQKIGSTTFKVYKYSGQDNEFYWFRQGNVAYMFNGDGVQKYMETFKFVEWN